MALAAMMVPVGALGLARLDLAWLSALLGALLIAYGSVSLLGLRLSIPPQREGLTGPVFGIVNGLLTGMTGSFVVPGVMFLQAIGLPRDTLVQAMGILFTLSTVALAVALSGNKLLSAELGWISTLGVVPAIIGMVLGQQLRKLLSEQLFRRVFFSSLLVLGAYIIVSAVGRV